MELSKKRAFGDLEFSVLNSLKEGEKLTVKEVHRRLGGTDKYNTIMTVMSRLAEKGYLGRERIGQSYIYWRKEQQPQGSLFQKLRKKFFGIKHSELVCCMLEESEEISNAEIEAMEQALKKARQKRGLQ